MKTSEPNRPWPTVSMTQLQSGANFADLARQYSDDENSRDSGGELGWYSADDLMPGFKEALADLDTNQVSRPVTSDFGLSHYQA